MHRYPDRVLLKLVTRLPGLLPLLLPPRDGRAGGARRCRADELDAALAYIAARPEIWEVILTGGDPFVLSPRRLARDRRARSARSPHVKVIRWHTRVPVVDAGRVTRELVARAQGAGKATYVGVHANHPRELTAAARAACARLVDAGIPW